MTDVYNDNVLVSQAAIANSLKGEYVVSPEHAAMIAHSKALDCNPHSKVKIKGESTGKLIGGKFVIFVPTTATTLPAIPSGKELIIDIRSMEGSGSMLFALFANIIDAFSCNAEDPSGKKGKVYMSDAEPYISDKPIPSNNQLKKCKTTILLDRYTFKAGDEYCAMLMAYFYKHFTVKGKPHHMYKFIHKTVRFPDGDKKISFALPVIKLIY
jgi:hypothetical protein